MGALARSLLLFVYLATAQAVSLRRALQVWEPVEDLTPPLLGNLSTAQGAAAAGELALPPPSPYWSEHHHTVFRVRRGRELLGTSLSIAPASGAKKLSNVDTVKVSLSNVYGAGDDDFVGLFTEGFDPDFCLSIVAAGPTGNFALAPNICVSPIKYKKVKEFDPKYNSCPWWNPFCSDSATLFFDVVNIRSNLQVGFFRGNYIAPVFTTRSNALPFAAPDAPLYGHLATTGYPRDASKMRVRWLSGSATPQQVRYGEKTSGRVDQVATSTVTTYTRQQMCGLAVDSAAKGEGWHDPGFIHIAEMTGLLPGFSYTYVYGGEGVGFSSPASFRVPPAKGSNGKLVLLVFGDMGKAPLDGSSQHYVNPGAPVVSEAMAKEVATGVVDVVAHMGDISYATGFLTDWEFWFAQVAPLTSAVPYMTSIGNHERDWPFNGGPYQLTDSGGECGVPYGVYFPMPQPPGSDQPWYSQDYGLAHVVFMSTEHDWQPGSVQYKWLAADMAGVDRSVTPWLIFTGHREPYTSNPGFNSNDPVFTAAIEPLLKQYEVDLALWGHQHHYERTCAVYQSKCISQPAPGANGIDTYTFAPAGDPQKAVVHVITGAAGFKLDGFAQSNNPWSLKRISQFGYSRVTITDRATLLHEFVSVAKGAPSAVADAFYIRKA